MGSTDEYDDDASDEDAWRDRSVTTAAEALEGFFLLERARTRGARLRRLDAAVADLCRCFDEYADRILTTGELATRDFERLFRPADAALRVAAAYAWLFVLRLWLDGERWWGGDLEDRRVRIALTVPFARYVARMPIEGEPDGFGGDLDVVEWKARVARSRLRAERARTR